MVDNNPIQRTNANSISPAASSKSNSAGKASSGPAFEALLEKLQQQAKSLQHDSETVAKPDELTGAVDRAADSLKDALSLSDQLLEAFRESQVEQPKSDPGSAA